MTKITNAQRAAQVVTAFLAGSEAVDAASAQLISAKSSMLASLRSQLKGCDPVDGDEWAKEWAEPTLKALLASGRYAVDDKGKSLSATVQASNLKIAVIAITNEIEPEGDAPTSLKNFVTAVRPQLVAEDLIEASTAGAKRKGADRKSTSREAEAGKAYAAACYLVAGKDRARSRMLQLIMSDHAEAFDEWADAYIVEADDKARKAKRTRR